MSWMDDTEKTLRVPSDYPTLQQAADNARDPMVRTRLIIESGHTITEGVATQRINLNHIRITAEDDVVPCNFDEWGRVVAVHFAQGPVLDCLFDMQHTGADGYYCFQASGYALARQDKRVGVINAGRNGAYIYRGSWFSCAGKREAEKQVEFGGAVEAGIRSYRSSWVAANNVNVDGSDEGLFAFDGSYIGAGEASARDCKRYGARSIYRSWINAGRDAEIVGSGETDLQVEDNGEINAVGSTFGTMNRSKWFAAWPIGNKGRIYT